MKYLTPINKQATRDFWYGACTPGYLETLIYYDTGYLPLHTTKTLEYILSSHFKYSLN